MADLTDLTLRFVINIIAMLVLLYGLYYPRHGDRETLTMAAMFNVFSFAVLGKISSVEFGLAAGFGLFAILALFSLRSIQLGRTDVAYFFGAIALAVICSIQGETAFKNAFISAVVVASVYLIDHPKFIRKSNVVRVTLDDIDPKILAQPDGLEGMASDLLGVPVTNLKLISFNQVKEQAVVDLSYDASVSTPQRQ